VSGLEAARAVAESRSLLAQFRAWALGETVAGDWEQFALRLAKMLQATTDELDKAIHPGA
jgi:hypothetical protein